MSPEELRVRVLFALLYPAAVLAAEVPVPLAEMKRLIELAYYREGKRRRLKMKELRELLSVSMSKVSLLSKHLKAHFAQPERAYGTPRKILSLLWAGPMSAVKIAQALDLDRDETQGILDTMVADRKLALKQAATPLYSLAEARYRLVQAPWMAKVDALNHLMESLTRVIETRFFEGDPRALARNLSFRVRPEDIPKLEAFYKEHVFPFIVELDGEAGDDAVGMHFSVMWAPMREQ